MLKQTILNPNNRLFALARQGRRQPSALVAIAVVLVMLALLLIPGQMLARLVVRLFPSGIQSIAAPIVENTVGFLPIYLGLWVWLRLSSKRPLWSLGLESQGAARHALGGALIAVLMMAVTAGVAIISGATAGKSQMTGLTAGLRALVASEIARLPRIHEIAIDLPVIAFTLGMSLAAGVLFGLIPVSQYARPQVAAGLRGGGRSLTGSRERHRIRGVLVTVQVALALVLLVGSGLMIRTFLALQRVDPGFSDASKIETVRIGIPNTQVSDPEKVIRMEEAILRKMETIAGVARVGAISALPLQADSTNPVYVDNEPPAEGKLPPLRRFKSITPGYLSAMGSRLIAGRDLSWTEIYNKTPVALVSENGAPLSLLSVPVCGRSLLRAIGASAGH